MPPKYETVEITIDDETIAEADLWTITYPVMWHVDIYNGPDEYEQSLKPFSNEQRLIFALTWYMSEVKNGGHKQFYGNSTGIVWRDASQAFEAIGLQPGAAIIRETANRMGGNPSRDREQRIAQLEEHLPDFSDLDSRFYELSRSTDIDQAMLEHIRSHSVAFHYSGQIQVSSEVVHKFLRE